MEHEGVPAPDIQSIMLIHHGCMTRKDAAMASDGSTALASTVATNGHRPHGYRKGPVQLNGPFSTNPLVFRPWREDVHDAVEVFNASEFDAHSAFTRSEGDLHVGIEPVRQ